MSIPTVLQVPIEAIVMPPQVRQHFDEASIDSLAATIREVGVLQPILARKHADKFAIVDGGRRFRAACKVGLQSVPVIIEDRELNGVELAQTQLIANCQREDLKPVEKARAIAQLMKASGWPATQVAAKLGLSAGITIRPDASTFAWNTRGSCPCIVSLPFLNPLGIQLRHCHN